MLVSKNLLNIVWIFGFPICDNDANIDYMTTTTSYKTRVMEFTQKNKNKSDGGRE